VRTQPRKGTAESKWPALVAMTATMALQLATQQTFPDEVRKIIQWAALPTEGLLLLFLFLKAKHNRHSDSERRAILVLSGLVALVNTISASSLVWHIIDGRHDNVTNNAVALLGTGAAIFVTNAIVFAIWYWQLDRGGPFNRWDGLANRDVSGQWHFLFTQDAADHEIQEKIHYQEWRPKFFDYLYLSFTNVVAFSPTDTMPLTHKAKALMAFQSLIAVSTLTVVLARAINVVNVGSRGIL